MYSNCILTMTQRFPLNSLWVVWLIKSHHTVKSGKTRFSCFIYVQLNASHSHSLWGKGCLLTATLSWTSPCVWIESKTETELALFLNMFPRLAVLLPCCELVYSALIRVQTVPSKTSCCILEYSTAMLGSIKYLFVKMLSILSQVGRIYI